MRKALSSGQPKLRGGSFKGERMPRRRKLERSSIGSRLVRCLDRVIVSLVRKLPRPLQPFTSQQARTHLPIAQLLHLIFSSRRSKVATSSVRKAMRRLERIDDVVGWKRRRGPPWPGGPGSGRRSRRRPGSVAYLSPIQNPGAPTQPEKSRLRESSPQPQCRTSRWGLAERP